MANDCRADQIHFMRFPLMGCPILLRTLFLPILLTAFMTASTAFGDDADAPEASVPISAEMRAECQRFAAWYWARQDAGSQVNSSAFVWNTQPPPSNLNPFGEALQLFSTLYARRLRPLDSHDPYSIIDLFADDPAILQQFRNYTITGYIVTSVADADIHAEHIVATIMALGADSSSGSGVTDVSLNEDGDAGCVELTTRNLRSSDVPPWLAPILTEPEPIPLPPLPDEVLEADRLLKEAEAIWKRWIVEMYRQFMLTLPHNLRYKLWQRDTYWDDTTTGFDCDDFADAFGRYLEWYVRQHSNGAHRIEPRVLQLRGGYSIEGHTMTLIFFGDYYWVIDAQTNIRTGPFHRYIQWPPDVSEVSEHYWPGYGYEFGIPMHYPAGWRPFYEEQPWYNDPVQRGRILELLPPEIPPDSIQP